MTEYVVIKNRVSDYINPITLIKGEKVKLLKKSEADDDWAGWIFCESKNNCGWIPEQIIAQLEDGGIVLEDYCAKEFDIEVNEVIVREKELNGWIWGYKKGASHLKAWSPLNHLKLRL